MSTRERQWNEQMRTAGYGCRWCWVARTSEADMALHEAKFHGAATGGGK